MMACFRKPDLFRLGALWLLTQSVLFAQQSTAAVSDQAFSAMQESVARQMASVAQAAAAASDGSLKAQRHSIRNQIALAGGGPSSAKPQSVIAAAEHTPAKPAHQSANQTQETVAAPDVVAGEPSSFFTSPWPEPEGFQMPNVQLQSEACDMLPETDVSDLIKAASSKHAVNADLIRAVMRQESGFRPCALSTAGAMGLMQLMPDTASDLGVSDPFDPAANVDAGTRYLKQMLARYNGDVTLALSAYNASPGRVDKTGGVPPISETMDYVSRILSGLPSF
jgi:soluble lytic murein transglycosylase-like protein